MPIEEEAFLQVRIWCVQIRGDMHVCAHYSASGSTHTHTHLHTHTHVFQNAGFWADEGSDTCTKCPPNSWSMPNTTLGTKGCFCDPGFFWDWYPDAPDANEEANFTCTSVLTLPCPGDNGTVVTAASDAQTQGVSNGTVTAGNSSKCVLYVNVTKRGRDCPGFKSCKEGRGTPENPCVRCPKNADSPAGAGSRADCFCQVRHVCVHVCVCVRAYVYRLLLSGKTCVCVCVCG